MDVVIGQLTQCIGFIRSGESTESVREATEWLMNFYQEPTAIQVLLTICTTFPDPIMRRFLCVAMKQCVNNSWIYFDEKSKSDVLLALLNLFKGESDYNNRQNILHIIQLKMNSSYYSVFIPFLQELSQSGNLELTLSLCPLVDVSEMEESSVPSAIEFLLTQIDQGFASTEILTRYAALFYLYLPNCRTDLILDRIPRYWELALEIFQPVYEQKELFTRVASLFNFAVNFQKFQIDVLPLLKLCLELVKLPGNDSFLLLEFTTIIESICTQYTEIVVESEYVEDIIQVFMLISIPLFEPDDSLAISQANFFEKTFNCLCQYQQPMEYLYSLFGQMESTPANHFIIIRSLASVFYCDRNFFLDKLNDICDVLVGGMQSDSLLLVEGSVSAVDTFLDNFYDDLGDLAEPLITAVYETAAKALTVDVITAFANILDKTNQSDFIFDAAFEFLCNVISEGEIVLQQAAINCMNMLVRSSSIKISSNLDDFMKLMLEIMNSSSEVADLLKPHCVECVHSAANNVGSEFDPYASVFLEFIVANLTNENSDLALTCFQALELMAIRSPEPFMQVVDQIMSKVLTLAATDPSQEYKQASFASATDEDLAVVESQYLALFKHSEIALRLISILTKMSPDLTERFLTHTLQCASIQSQSCNSDCKCAAAFAVTCIADALASPDSEPPEATTVQMSNIILAVIPNAEESPESKEAIDGFSAAAHMIDVLDYQSFGSKTRELIDTAMRYITYLTASSDRQLVSQCQDTLYSIRSFISMVAASAGPMAFNLLQNFMPVCTELITTNVPQLRSFGLSYFTAIISTCAQSFDIEFKKNLMQTAMQIADEADDSDAFIFIHQVARNEPALIVDFSDDIYNICMKKLTLPISNTDKFYRMRDNCIIAFELLVWKVCVDKYDINEYIDACISAMPLVMDYEYITEQIEFFYWLYERADQSYKESFLQILVVLFALPKHALDNMKIPVQYITNLINFMRELINSFPNADELISTFLENDQERISYFQAILNPSE